MLDRARAEVAVLSSRREDITRQLGSLSGVIEALSVDEAARAGGGTAHSGSFEAPQDHHDTYTHDPENHEETDTR